MITENHTALFSKQGTMTPLQNHPCTASLVTFSIGVLLVTLMGRLCSRMSRSKMYALCLYYVFVALLSSSIIIFGARYGYILVEKNGECEGVLGSFIGKAINFMGDIYLSWNIFCFDAVSTVASAMSIFVLAGLTSSLPRRERMVEPFGRAFLKL